MIDIRAFLVVASLGLGAALSLGIILWVKERSYRKLKEWHEELSCCHDEHYQDMLSLMEQVGMLVEACGAEKKFWDHWIVCPKCKKSSLCFEGIGMVCHAHELSRKALERVQLKVPQGVLEEGDDGH